MRILVVEDEPGLNEIIVKKLAHERYSVDSCLNGLDAEDYLAAAEYDAVVLDIMLPGRDGLEVLRSLRAAGKKTPVLLLTARDSIDDRVRGLDAGADDYLVKPFALEELLARIRVMMRHVSGTASNTIAVGDLTIDCSARMVHRAGKAVSLTAKEFDVLELLVFNPNKVYSRENLLNIVWGYEYPGDVRTVDVHIRRLREKIETNPSEPKYVHTKWGVGYYFQA